jgi:hypothetical protein
MKHLVIWIGPEIENVLEPKNSFQGISWSSNTDFVVISNGISNGLDCINQHHNNIECTNSLAFTELSKTLPETNRLRSILAYRGIDVDIYSHICIIGFDTSYVLVDSILVDNDSRLLIDAVILLDSCTAGESKGINFFCNEALTGSKIMMCITTSSTFNCVNNILSSFQLNEFSYPTFIPKPELIKGRGSLVFINYGNGLTKIEQIKIAASILENTISPWMTDLDRDISKFSKNDDSDLVKTNDTNEIVKTPIQQEETFGSKIFWLIASALLTSVVGYVGVKVVEAAFANKSKN